MESKEPKGKSTAVIAYLTFIGLLIAYFINRDDEYEFATWHIKNMFGLVLILIVSQVTQAYINLHFGEIIWIISFVLWIYSMIMAILGKKKGIPMLSEKFQEWFLFLN